MKHYTWTFIGLAIALLLLAADLIWNLEIFERFAQELARMEAYEIDEFVIPSFLLILFSLIDLIRFKKTRKALQEKQQIYKAMVQASDHVLKNCLNQMQLIRYEAEETPGFDQKTLELFDKSIKETVDQLEALGKIDKVDEEKIGRSVNIRIYR